MAKDKVLQAPIWMYFMREFHKHKSLNATGISKNVDVTYSHTAMTLKILQGRGLIVCRRKGRIKIFTLTEDGAKLAAAADTVLALANIN